MEKERSKKLPPNVEIFDLTAAFIIFGMLFYLTALIAGFWIIPDLAGGQPVRSTAGWSLVHLLVLGFATMVAMGASCQLIQVLMRTSIYSKKLACVHFYFSLAGILLLVSSFYSGFFQGIALGGTLFLIGVLVYVYNMIRIMLRQKEWNPYVFGTLASLFNLLATVVSGLLMGIAIGYQWLPFSYQDIFHSHLWLGLIGWLIGLVITYTFKLLPMFYNSPKKAVKEAYLIIGLWQAGVWLQVLAIWTGSLTGKAVALLAIIAALLLLIRFSRDVALQARKKDPGGAVAIARYLLTTLLVLIVVWSVSVVFFPDARETALVTEAIACFLIVGWFLAVILSYLSKIIPFLWWAYRFQTKWQKKSRVLLSEMTRDRRLKSMLGGYLAGSAMVSLALFFELSPLAWAGQIITVVLAVFYMAELARVLQY